MQLMDINKIMASSPYFEVLIRNLYWQLPSVVGWYNTKHKNVKKSVSQISSQQLVRYLASKGIGEGDLLVLHSSFNALRAQRETPNQVIDCLLALIGRRGTLAMPAIPIFKDSVDITKRMKADMSALVLDYDPLSTPAWTGALANTLIKYPGAVRSLHPLNSMVAVGPLAEPMMAANISEVMSLPCGRNSSWYFCYLNNAKVIAVGADLAHSLTMIHVAEDMWEDDWVVPGWYRQRKFRVRINDKFRSVMVRERHPKWAMHYAERTLSKDLIREGITTKISIEGVNVEILNAKTLVNYLNSRNKSAYPYYLVPLKR